MVTNIIHTPTASNLMKEATMDHISRSKVGHDMGIGTNLYDLTLKCDDVVSNNFDIGKELWFKQARWTNLIRSYLDPELTSRFILASRKIAYEVGNKGIVTEMQFRGNARSDKKHKWGNCLLSASFRGQFDSHITPTLVFHSRVTYMGYISGLDIALASVIAKYIEYDGHFDGQKVEFIWKLDVSQVHAFKTLPWLYANPDLFKRVMELNTPTAERIKKWHDTVLRYESEGKTIEEEIYGPFRRVRQMYDLSNNNERKPELFVRDLTLDKLEGFNV